MKYFLLLPILFLAACASTPKKFDRTDQQKEYVQEEAKNQARSLTRSEWMARASALNSQIKSIDSQIQNQRNLIKRWKEQPDVASSQAMIENANIRIRHLKEERALLEQQKLEADEEVKKLQVMSTEEE